MANNIEFDVKVDDSGAVSANAKITQSNQKVEESFQDVDAAAERSSKSVKKSGDAAAKAMGKLGRNSGQAGVQIQQFVGQVQAGTSPLLAFSQQAADLGIVLGAPLVGAIVGIGASLAMAFIPEMKESAIKTQDVIDKLKDLQETYKLTATELDLLSRAQSMEGDERQKRIKELKEEIAEFDGYSNALTGAALGNNMLTNAIGEFIPNSKAQRKELLALQFELSQLQRLENEGGGQVSDKEQSKIDAAKESMRRRVEVLRAGVTAESELLNTALRNRIQTEIGAMTELEEAQRNAEAKRLMSLQSQSDARILQIQTEAERIKESDLVNGEERKALLDNLRMAELEAINNFEVQKTNIEEQGVKARMMLAEREKQSKLSMLSSMFGNLSSLMNTESRKMFEIGKAAAVSQAVVDGYAAVSATMKATPYPWNIPLAAAQAVASFAQVKGIMSTSYGSKGSGQVYSGGQVATATAATASAGPSAPNRVLDVAGFASNGNYSFTGQELISLLREAVGDGYTVQGIGG